MLFNGLMCHYKAWRRCAAAAAILVCLLFLALAAGDASAQNRILGAVTLTPNTTELLLNRYTIVQRDPDNKVNAQSIRDTYGAILNGTMPQGDMLYLGYDGVPLWLSVKLQNKSNEDTWIIDLGRRVEGRIGQIDDVSAYQLSVSYTGAAGTPPAIDLQQLITEERNGIYRVTIAPNEEKLIVMNIVGRAGQPTLVPLKIYSQKAYLAHIHSRAVGNTFFAMLLCGFGIYFIAASLSRRRPSFAVTGLYFIYLAAGWIIYDTIGSEIGSVMVGLILAALFLGFSMFAIFTTKIFCGIEYGSYSEKYILYGLAVINLVMTAIVLLLPTNESLLHVALLYSAPAITISVLSLMAIAQKRNGTLRGYAFFYCWVVPLVGLIVSVLSFYDIFPQNAIFINAFWYAFVVQGMFMISAFNERLSLIAEDDRGSNNVPQILNLPRLKETKDMADHTRLLKVIEKEREQLADFRAKEAQRTEDMRHAKEEADEANRAKSAFLAVVSHEIRTPMTGIMGMVRLLLDSNISKQQRDYALTIQESSEAMLALLNDILDFEKIQRGKIDLENISFDLHRLIQGIVTLMSGHAQEKGITLSARVDDDLPRFVKGDPTRLRQILLNLMGNGIKFTEKGSVTLLVKILNMPDQDAQTQSDKHMIYFAVQDSGIGIPADAQKSLFSPFSQANASITRKFGGSGLGLAISKGLIENMGSSVNINSKEGEGSTFFFTLEMEKGLSISQDAPRRAVMPEEEFVRPLKILIVDDNAINRKVIAGFLESGKHEMVNCGSADEALDKINRYDFDLVLMDIELPGIKGNEATKILREHGQRSKAQIPVIALTGNIGREDKERYLADGMNGFLGKPIDPDKLRATVKEIAMKSFEREIKAPGQPERRYEPDMPVNIEPAEPATAPEPINYDGVFNPDMLQSLKDTIGATSLSELLNDLIAKTEEILAAMDQAAQTGDLEALAARAHELKGMAGNFGLVEISSIAAQAERKAKNKESDGIVTLIDSLPSASVRARSILKDWVGAA